MNIEHFKSNLKFIIDNKLHIGKKKSKTLDLILNDIKYFYPNFYGTNLSKLYFWILNDIDNDPKCKKCDNLVTKFRSIKDGYNSNFCCMKCALSDDSRTQKSKQTCLERYGVENPLKLDSIRKKSKQTCLERYGVENPQQNKTIRNKTTKTFYEKYGENFFKTRAKYKNFILPSGSIIKYQGYENIAISNLLKTYHEDEIFIHKTPKIYYIFNNLNKFHLPDIFIPHENLLIEVKSWYTLNIKLEQNLIKQNAAKMAGFKYEIWVCDKNQILEKIK